MYNKMYYKNQEIIKLFYKNTLVDSLTNLEESAILLKESDEEAPPLLFDN